ncbi:hypothetical protein MUS_2892 [Bacillus velezensis YAU B9601-Y2]|uniref:Uncharacterized protein n=1 Tax=Bacillus amyloliquefaciens (strain Y2) TaxID=1155777 RepID=I2C825_BACAY|nr:hypothetical protein MUS_2892 [Bacillus velezensis YAU B9601-Y2]
MYKEVSSSLNEAIISCVNMQGDSPFYENGECTSNRNISFLKET